MSAKKLHVLFLCTGNSARSIMAECVLRRLGGGRFEAHSAGSRPTGAVHPLALRALSEFHGHDVSALRSKSWDEFAAPGAPALDHVITVCDNAKDESCPILPGRPTTDHWGLEDPAAFDGSEADQLAFFLETYGELEERISRFIAETPAA